MKQRFAVFVLVAGMMALCLPGFGQVTDQVAGTCTDIHGQPIVGATVEYHNLDNGSIYKLKTDKKGHYFSLGLSDGTYTVTLLQNGTEVFHFNKVRVAGNLTLDFDMQKEQARSAQQNGLSPEQLKQQQAAAEQHKKQGDVIKNINVKLAAATEAENAGNYDLAISTLQEAAQLDPKQDLVWARLGQTDFNSANKLTDASAKTDRYNDAITNYQKAIDAKKAATASLPSPEANHDLAGYYNGLAEAQGKVGKSDDAMKSYEQAVQLDPTHAAQYYYNEGALLTNSNKIDDAIAAFDKCIAADPTKADAYYWKGINLLGKATMKGSVMVAPEGTAEAFNKYLQLQPNGQFADPAKQMLQQIGAKVQTEYGSKKKSGRK